MKKKKNVKFIVLLCANIVFFLSCLFTLIYHGSYLLDYWHIEFILQCILTLAIVAVYYIIVIAQSVKKLADQKDVTSSSLSNSDRTQTTRSGD